MTALLLLALASAHDPNECPPAAMLEDFAEKGALAAPLRTCLDKVADDPDGRITWARWWDRFHREGPSEDVTKAALEVLDRRPDPDRALAVAERLVEVAPPAATRASEVALAHSGEWTGAEERADRVARLGKVAAKLDPNGGPVRWAQAVTAVGLVGPDLDEARAACLAVADAGACTTAVPLPGGRAKPAHTPEDWIPCSNPGHLWMRARFGAVFTTERDCLAELAAAEKPGAAQQVVARTAAQLALRHEERSRAPVVFERLSALLPGDAALAALAWRVHVAFGDEAGAARWATRVSDPP